jgi:hypothetical protein
VFVTLGFLAVLAVAGLVQTGAELRRGERPQALDLFDRAPTAANLHAFEHDLVESSLVVNRLRPWMQFAQFALLADAGENALASRDGWLFYRPGLRAATERPSAAPRRDGSADPFPAIKSFHDQLSARGIRLLVVPAPNKESVYPDLVARRAAGAGVVVGRPVAALLESLRAAGIEVVDLFEVFHRARLGRSAADPARLYLARDSHWSPQGMQVAVDAVARRVLDLGWVQAGPVAYDERPVRLRRLGDLVRMSHAPPLERALAPEGLDCAQVVRRQDGSLYRDATDARILILGDSFLRIYEQDEPGSAGFIAHLARALGQPLTSIVNDGGASTLVRQDLARRPRLLANKTVVIWEFVERDILGGTEGWQIVAVPK